MRRIVRYLAYALGAVAVLAAAGAVFAPMLLDRPRIAAELQAKLSKAVRGDVRWEGFSVRLLPRPQAEMRGLRVKTEAATFGTDDLILALRLWPLLFEGRPEVTSLAVARPTLRLTFVPAAEVPEEARLEKPQTPLEAYRAVMGGLADALQDFAPDTVVSIDNGEVDISIEGGPRIEARQISLRARTSGEGVELELAGVSPYWSSMKIGGRIRYADLSSSADVQLTRVQGQAWLDYALRKAGVQVAVPDLDVSARFRGHPSKALELDFEGRAAAVTVTRGPQRFAVAPASVKATATAGAEELGLRLSSLQAGPSSLADGTLRYALKDGALSVDSAFQLSLPQALGYAGQIAPEAMARIESASGTLGGRATLVLKGGEFHAGARADKSDAALRVKEFPGPLRLSRAAVEVDPRSIKLGNAAVAASMGEVQVSSAQYVFKTGAASAVAEYDLDLDKVLDLLKVSLQSPGGRAKGAVSLRATPKALDIERASIALLDSTLTASARVSDFAHGPDVQGSVASAVLGAKGLDWIWQVAKISPDLALRAPVRLSASQVSWSRQGLAVQANAQPDRGPAVSVNLAWSPSVLDVRRATIKDSMSDLTVALQMKGGVYEGRYKGTLDSRSIAALRRGAKVPAGVLTGDFAFKFDRAEPARTTADGSLKAQNLDLSWLAGKPAKLEQMELAADAAGLRISNTTLEWAGQRASLQAETRRGPDGPVVDARIDSPGLVVDALLPPPSGKKADGDPTKNLWPLPVTGRLAVRSKFVKYGNYTVQPLSADLVLERERAHLEVNEAFLCGFALPLTLEATPGGLAAGATLFAEKQKLEEAAQCLSGEKVVITGPMDLRAELRTHGRPDELVQNLRGTVSADVRNGEVTRFALLGNILSLQNVVALTQQGGPKLSTESFPFRQLSARGRFDKGRFILDEGVFHSNAIGLGANGWISLSDFDSKLTVLVAPLALVDEAVRKLPVLGYVIGGTFTSLPVSVSGDIRDPTVVPLGPRAITSELTGILSRTIKLPGRLVPGQPKE